jgi:hypothetical protein
MPGSWGNAGVMWNRELQDIITRYHNELAWQDATRDVVLGYMAAHPLDVLVTLPGKVLHLFASDIDGFGWSRAGTPSLQGAAFWTPLRAVAQGYYLAICTLFCVYLIRLVRDRGWRTPELVLGPMVIAYFTIIYAVFAGGPRFHFPVIPWIYACGAAAMAMWHQRVAAD